MLLYRELCYERMLLHNKVKSRVKGIMLTDETSMKKKFKRDSLIAFFSRLYDVSLKSGRIPEKFI